MANEEQEGPRRLQRRKFGWKAPTGLDAVYVGRPGVWGNPYRIGAHGVPDRETAVARFRQMLEWRRTGTGPSDLPNYPPDSSIRKALAGKVLVCWCPLSGPCHGDVLWEIANS